MKTGAIIGTGLGVSVVTGGVGIGPYLYGIGAATRASIALDGAVQARLATGDWPGAADQASYHLPFWGNARSGLAAWQQGDRSEAAFYAALFGLETLGLKGAGRSPTGARVAEGWSKVPPNWRGSSSSVPVNPSTWRKRPRLCPPALLSVSLKTIALS